jgi:hypothetical protein
MAGSAQCESAKERATPYVEFEGLSSWMRMDKEDGRGWRREGLTKATAGDNRRQWRTKDGGGERKTAVEDGRL